MNRTQQIVSKGITANLGKHVKQRFDGQAGNYFTFLEIVQCPLLCISKDVRQPIRVQHLPKKQVERTVVMVTTRAANQGVENHRSSQWKEVLDLSRTTIGVEDRKLHYGRRRLIKTVCGVREELSSLVLVLLSISVSQFFSLNHSLINFYVQYFTQFYRSLPQ